MTRIAHALLALVLVVAFGGVAVAGETVTIITEIFYDADWHDITADVRNVNPVRISDGIRNEGPTAGPGNMTIQLNNGLSRVNPDVVGRYSPRNPMSDLYGKIGRNTPVRVSATLAGGTPSVRTVMEIPAWPATWGRAGRADSWVNVQAAGILRRLGQSDPLKSALQRAILASSPDAYWTLEDGTSATRAGSALSTGADLTLEGSGPRGGTLYPAGSSGAWDFTGGGTVEFPYGFNENPGGWLSGPTGLDQGTTGLTSSYEFEATALWDELPTAPVGTPTIWRILTLLAPTGYLFGAGFQLGYVSSAWRVNAFLNYDPTIPASANSLVTTDLSATGPTVIIPGVPMHMRLVIHVGIIGIIDARMFVNGQFVSFTGTGVGTSEIGIPNLITINRGGSDDRGDPSANVPSLSHVAIRMPAQETNETPPDEYTEIALEFEAADGHVGETAGRRAERLCTEESVAFASIGDLDGTAPMGPQLPASLLTLLGETAVAEAAGALLPVVTEQRTALGLRFRTLASHYNQAAALALNYAAGHVWDPFEPTPDDQHIANDVTAKRPNGGQYTSVQESGPLNVNNPVDDPQGVGRYPKPVDANVETDAQLAGVAGWRRHVGTWDEERYPILSLDIRGMSTRTGGAALVADILALELGDLVTIDNPPEWMAPDQVAQLILGRDESISTSRWTV